MLPVLPYSVVLKDEIHLVIKLNTRPEGAQNPGLPLTNSDFDATCHK